MTRAGVVLLAAGVLAAAGCGGPELTTVASQGIVLDRPAGWEEITDLPQGDLVGRQGWVGELPGPGRAGLFVDVFCADDVGTVADALVAQGRAQVESFSVRRRRSTQVPGADAATFIESTYRERSTPAATGTAEATTGPSVALTRMDVLAVSGGLAVRVAVTGPTDTLDRGLARRIVDSLRLRGGDLEPLADVCAGRGGTEPPVGDIRTAPPTATPTGA